MGKLVGALVTIGILGVVAGGVLVGVGYATTKDEAESTLEKKGGLIAITNLRLPNISKVSSVSITVSIDVSDESNFISSSFLLFFILLICSSIRNSLSPSIKYNLFIIIPF